MGDISKNFDRSEFACKGRACCGHSAPVHPYLINGLQKLRDAINCPLIISSGFRCNKHNGEIGGSPTSQHRYGMAADVYTNGEFSPARLAAIAECIPEFTYGGIGIYSSWIHLDVRGTSARWDFTK